MAKLTRTKPVGSIRRNTLAKLRSLIHFRNLLKQSKQAKTTGDKPAESISTLSTAIDGNSDIIRSSSYETVEDLSTLLSQYCIETETQKHTCTDFPLESKDQNDVLISNNTVERYSEHPKGNNFVDSKKIDNFETKNCQSSRGQNYSNFNYSPVSSFNSLIQTSDDYTEPLSRLTISDLFSLDDEFDNSSDQNIFLTPYEHALFASENISLPSSHIELFNEGNDNCTTIDSESNKSSENSAPDSDFENSEGGKRIAKPNTNLRNLIDMADQKHTLESIKNAKCVCLHEDNIFTNYEKENLFVSISNSRDNCLANTQGFRSSVTTVANRKLNKEITRNKKEPKRLACNYNMDTFDATEEPSSLYPLKKWNERFYGSVETLYDGLNGRNLMTRDEEHLFTDIELSIFLNGNVDISCNNYSPTTECENGDKIQVPDSVSDQLPFRKLEDFSLTKESLEKSSDKVIQSQFETDCSYWLKSPLENENCDFPVSNNLATFQDLENAPKYSSGPSCKQEKNERTDCFQLDIPSVTVTKEMDFKYGHNKDYSCEENQIQNGSLVYDKSSEIYQNQENEALYDNFRTAFHVESEMQGSTKKHDHHHRYGFQNLNNPHRNPKTVILTKKNRFLRSLRKSSHLRKKLMKKPRAVLAIMDILLSRMEDNADHVCIFEQER